MITETALQLRLTLLGSKCNVGNSVIAWHLRVSLLKDSLCSPGHYSTRSFKKSVLKSFLAIPDVELNLKANNMS